MQKAPPKPRNGAEEERPPRLTAFRPDTFWPEHLCRGALHACSRDPGQLRPIPAPGPLEALGESSAIDRLA